MTTEKIRSKDNIWSVVFVVVPTVLLSKISVGPGDSAINEIIFAGIFGALGAVLGWAMYKFVKYKSATAKVVSVLVLGGLCAGIIFGTKLLINPNLKTCEVCGYQTLRKKDVSCDDCGNSIWAEKQKMTIFKSKEEWLRDAQLFWFAIDSVDQKINFYEPGIDKGFVKDNSWKPLITEQEIKDDFSKSSHEK